MIKLVSRASHPDDSVVRIGPHHVGGGHFQTIAGPCAIESRRQLHDTVRPLAAGGVNIIRAGAYKPRTSPYDFQGLGEEGLRLLAEVKRTFGVTVITELTSTAHLPAVAAVADALQIGARNCQNYDLLRDAAGAGLPVVLKRGMATRVDEWISAAEYLMVNGCSDVILCERGIRTFETATRSTLDLGAVAIVKQETHLPVIVDPSHAAGRRELVLPLALAAVAAGADGLLVETHCNPAKALCDASQQIPTAEFPGFLCEVERMAHLLGKRVAQPRAAAA